MKPSWSSFWLAAAILLPVLAVIACLDWIQDHRPSHAHRSTDRR